MFKNFDEVEKTLLKVLSDLADITEEAKKIATKQEQQKSQKQLGGCDDCTDCASDFSSIEDEWEAEEEDFEESMKWLEARRHDFVNSFISWMDALPYLPDSIIKELNLNYIELEEKISRCLENQVEPMIALTMLNNKQKGKDFGIADILSAFNFKVTAKKEEKEKEDEQELLNELKRAALNLYKKG